MCSPRIPSRRILRAASRLEGPWWDRGALWWNLMKEKDCSPFMTAGSWDAKVVERLRILDSLLCSMSYRNSQAGDGFTVGHCFLLSS